MKNNYFFVLFLFVGLTTFAQRLEKRNAVYAEAGGAGLFGSLNYERQLIKDAGLGIHIGLGFYTEKAFYLTLPVGINYLFSLNNTASFIDAGIGATWARKDAKLFNNKTADPDNFVSFIPSIGYRKHTANGLLWRVSVTPVANNKAFTPWVGIAVGKRF